MFTLTSFQHNNQEYFLKLLTHQYAEPLANMVRKDYDYLAQFLPWPKKDMSAQDEHDFITMELQNFAIGKSCVCGITNEKNEIFGTIGIIAYDTKNRRGEIGYWMAQEYGGKGIMTQTVIHFADAIHTMRNCSKLCILAQHNNIGSNRVAEKAGFTSICTLKKHIMQNGVLEDMNLYEKYWE